MSTHRLWSLSLASFSLLLLGLGCQSPATIDPLEREDSFGIRSAEINEETVYKAEMLHQRAQLELKGGVSIPWDFFDPSEDPLTDPGAVVGTKFDFEVAKNVFLGASFDWVRHQVEDPSGPLGTADEAVQHMEAYDRYVFMGNFDYDIPLGDEELSPILRLGAGVGMMTIQPIDRFSGDRKVETFFNVVIRPTLGIRFPLDDNFLLFLEGTYDIVPRRTLHTVDDDRIRGSKPIFGAGMFWLGVAFQWH